MISTYSYFNIVNFINLAILSLTTLMKSENIKRGEHSFEFYNSYQ